MSGLVQLFFLVIGLVLSVLPKKTDESDEYVQYKVYRIFPKKWSDILLLNRLRETSIQSEVDFWQHFNVPGRYTDVMVSSKKEPTFKDILNSNNLLYNVTVNDVQRLIMNVEHGGSTMNSNFSARLKDDVITETSDGGRAFEKVGRTKAEYRFGEYSSYASMVRYLRTIEFYYPHLVRLIRIGTSHEGRPIEGVKIGFPVASVTKRAVWVDGNIHAREWASSHTALFMINQLVAGYGTDERISDYLNTLNIFIVPCLNPDGYEYSRSSVLPQIRLWRKNRSPERCIPTQWGGVRCCQGVDLNRNFDFHWAETGSSENPCSNLYAGEYAFSEPESHAVANFLESEHLKGKLDGFVTLHTYAQMWIHPYSHIRHRYPVDYEEMKSVADKATQRIQEIYGTEYQIGTGADLLSPAAGGSDDWAKDTLGVKYVYLLELRPNNNIRNGFILDRTELLPVGVETFEGLKVMFDRVIQMRRPLQGFVPDSFNASTPNSLDIRRLTSTTQMPFSSQTSTSITSTTSTTTVTTTTTTAIPTSTSTQTTTTTSTTTTATTTPSTTTTKITTVSKKATAAPATRTFARITSMTPKSNTSELLRGLSVETRKQLSEELLRKQFMRIKTLQNLTSTPAPSTSKAPCVDRKYSCAFWINADPRACRLQKRFMQANCAVSCGFCSINS